jgi:mono/diheme cytochrome c family protein
MALFISLVVYSAAIDGNPVVDRSQFPPTYLPSGEQMFRQFCAACHGADAKGHGPGAYSQKTPPADLTTLAKRHGGKFPYPYVSDVLLFGRGVAAHGSVDMPTWGPLFRYLDRRNEVAVRQRIKNLSDYLATLQEN